MDITGWQKKNQIDCIAIAQKWKGSIRYCKTYPGADCDTDHNLLVAKMKIKLKRDRKVDQPKRLNLEELNGPKAEIFAIEVKNRFEALSKEREERTPEELWRGIKTTII
jgi:hypothetical protein